MKSCLLLAGLVTEATTIIEPIPTRDHTERMLLRGGAADHSRGRRAPRLPHDRRQRRRARTRDDRRARRPELGGVPDHGGRARSRLAAAARARRRQLDPDRAFCGSSSGWARSSSASSSRPARSRRTSRSPTSTSPARPIEGTSVEPHEVPLAIDELPLVALLGCFAEGETIVRGAAELRVKESDRIATVVDGLRGLGADIEAAPDGFVVRGGGEAARRTDRRPRRPPARVARRGRRARL